MSSCLLFEELIPFSCPKVEKEHNFLNFPQLSFSFNIMIMCSPPQSCLCVFSPTFTCPFLCGHCFIPLCSLCAVPSLFEGTVSACRGVLLSLTSTGSLQRACAEGLGPRVDYWKPGSLSHCATAEPQQIKIHLHQGSLFVK